MEDFVPFDILKKHKEKGFKTETTDWCYLGGNLVQVKKYINISPYEYAPTISQVLKWLRKEKKLHISIEYEYEEIPVWDFEIRLIGNYGRWWTDETYSSYELAALAGIEYTLNNLI